MGVFNPTPQDVRIKRDVRMRSSGRYTELAPLGVFPSVRCLGHGDPVRLSARAERIMSSYLEVQSRLHTYINPTTSIQANLRNLAEFGLELLQVLMAF